MAIIVTSLTHAAAEVVEVAEVVEAAEGVELAVDVAGVEVKEIKLD